MIRKIARRIGKIAVSCVKAASVVFEVIGVYALLRFLRRDQTLILMYHGVTKDGSGLENFDGRHVDAGLFERQITYLKKNYNIISLDEYIGSLRHPSQQKKPAKKRVILTFDDGYANNLNVLGPLIKKHKTPVIIYLPALLIEEKEIYWSNIVSFCIARTREKQVGLKIGSSALNLDLSSPKARLSSLITAKKNLHNIPDDERKKAVARLTKSCKVRIEEGDDIRFVSWDDARKLKKELGSLVSFGSHTLSHPLLSWLPENRIKDELSGSRALLAKRLCEPRHLSYPFGDYDKRVVKIARPLYISAVTTKQGYNTGKTDVFALKRVPVSNNNGMPLFMLSLFVDLGRYAEFFAGIYLGLKRFLAWLMHPILLN